MLVNETSSIAPLATQSGAATGLGATFRGSRSGVFFSNAPSGTCGNSWVGGYSSGIVAAKFPAIMRRSLSQTSAMCRLSHSASGHRQPTPTRPGRHARAAAVRAPVYWALFSKDRFDYARARVFVIAQIANSHVAAEHSVTARTTHCWSIRMPHPTSSSEALMNEQGWTQITLL